MKFTHGDEIWARFPNLRAVAVHVTGVGEIGDTSEQQQQLLTETLATLDSTNESELAPIRAWRQTYAAMGYKPTQYRCASESLLRRLRMSGDLPQINPFVDLCNALSVAWAMPVAAFDLSHVAGSLTVCEADGSEIYHAFGGGIEQPLAGEVIFRDDEATAHARRWAHRQSARSVISAQTVNALVVVEGHHDNAAGDAEAVADTLSNALISSGSARAVARASLSPGARIFEVADA